MLLVVERLRRLVFLIPPVHGISFSPRVLKNTLYQLCINAVIMQVPLPVYVIEGFLHERLLLLLLGAESLHVSQCRPRDPGHITGLRGRGTSADFVSSLPQRNNLPRNMLPLI